MRRAPLTAPPAAQYRGRTVTQRITPDNRLPPTTAPPEAFFGPIKKKAPAKKAPPRGKSSAAPDVVARRAAAVAAGSPDAASLISQYNLARAKILQGMAPQVQGIYSGADSELQHDVGAITGDMRSRLFGAGQAESNALKNQIGSEFDTNVTPSYNADAAANAAQILGATFPGESLTKQGAGFGAAAAFAPERALTEGQYALQAALKASALSSAKLSAVNPGVSKILGYVADAQGNPILDKKGKPIPVSASGTPVGADGLTAYQRASLGIRTGSLKQSADLRREEMHLRALGMDQSDAHFIANMNFKTAVQKQKAIEAITKGEKIDWTASGKAGRLINKAGDFVEDKHGRAIKFTPPAKAPTTAAIAKSVGKGQVFLRQHTRPFLYSVADPSKPLTPAEIASYAKAAGVTVNDFMYDPGTKGTKARKNSGVDSSAGIGQHDDAKIQKLYLTLVREYQIPARRAFNMVAKYYGQWAAHNRPHYFPGAA